MRQARIKKAEEAYYHVTSRCALQSFLMGREEKDMFVKMMRRAEFFSGVHIITYCVMDNHFHLLVKVPQKRAVPETELRGRITTLYGEAKAKRIFSRWDSLEEAGDSESAAEEQESFRKRMYDVSEFMKTLKQRYSVWYCSNHKTANEKGEERKIEGTIWQGRFHSVLVEGSQKALTAVAAYIDLNPARAKIAHDAKAYRWSGYGAAKRGDNVAKRGHGSIEGALYDDIIKAKQDGLSTRIASVSRGLAFGSKRFVTQSIACANGRRTNTIPLPLAKQGGLSMIFSTVRKKRDA